MGNNKGLKACIIIMIFVCIISGYYFTFNLRKIKNSSKIVKNNAKDLKWLEYKAELNPGSYPLNEHNYEEGYNEYNNEIYRIYIDENKRLSVEIKFNNKIFTIDNINNAKCFLVNHNDLTYVVLTEDEGVYVLDGLSIVVYANPNSQYYIKNIFKKVEKFDDNIMSNDNINNFFQIEKIYMTDNYYSDGHTVSKNKLYYALADDGKLYRITKYIIDDDETFKYGFKYELYDNKSSIEQETIEKNNNLVFSILKSNYAIGLKNNGDISVFYNQKFYDNILDGSRDIKFSKILTDRNFEKVYFISDENKLYYIDLPNNYNSELKFYLQEIEGGKRIKNIKYYYPISAGNNNYLIKNFTFIFEDNSKYIIKYTESSYVFGISKR